MRHFFACAPVAALVLLVRTAQADAPPDAGEIPVVDAAPTKTADHPPPLAPVRPATPPTTAPLPVHAPRAHGSPYELRWEFDVPIYGLGVAGTMTAFVGYDPPACLPSCTPPASMLGFDELVVGNYNRGAHGVANVAVLGFLVAPMAFDLADSKGEGFLEDAVVFYQTILVTQALTQITKSAVRRHAPLVYSPKALPEDLENADAGRSFPSGHTSTSFAAATAYSVTFWQRHPDSPWRFVVPVVAGTLATGVGLLKIEAGYHYPTDIVAGALLGISTGILVPMLHSAW